MFNKTESKAFAERLRFAPGSCGESLSPSVVASEFNLLYWGQSMTQHRARNWLTDDYEPKQDKLRGRAEW
jgi:hypothetical protein